MRIRRALSIGLALLGILAIVRNVPVGAAYLESDYQGTESTRQTPAGEAIRRPPPPEPDDAVIDLIRRIEVGAPHSHGVLTVFPLRLRAGDHSGIATLDEGLNRGWLRIRERDSAQVSEVLVRNDSNRHVLLVAGEIIAGGRQNRIIRSDVLLPPESQFIGIPVYCVEKERWAGKVETFSSPRSFAHPELRAGVAKGESQSRIWAEVDEQSDKAKVSSPTRDYQSIYENREVARHLDDYVGGFRRHHVREDAGAVVVSGNGILGCDVFSDPDLFSALWEKLMRSYAAGVFGRDRAPRTSITGDDVRRYLDRVLSARYSREHSPGEGRLVRIGGNIDGVALVWNARAVHINLLGETVRIEEDRPRPVPRDPSPGPEPIVPMPQPQYDEHRLWPKDR